MIKSKNQNKNNNKKSGKNTKIDVKTKKQVMKERTKVLVCDRKYDMNKYKALLKTYFAHRGVHNIYPENSLPAFQEAVNLKIGIELDCRLTKDREVVVFHDDTLTRMTGEKEYVRFLTLHELRKYRLNTTTFTIPTLKETLSLVNGAVPILLEVKTECNTKKICKHIIDIINQYKGVIFIQSFNPFVLRYFYKHAPQYLRGQLSSFFIGSKIAFFKRLFIKKLKLNKYSHIDFVSYNINDLPNKYVNKTCVPILTWTIKTEEQLKKGKVNSNNLIIDNIDLINPPKNN